MEEIERPTRSKKTPLPYQYFDLIGGTSPGGLIVIMLGRLRMTVDKCINKYIKLYTKVFDVDRVLERIIPVGDNHCRFNYKHLESAIKAMVKKRLGDENAMMENFGGVATFVATKELRADGPPILFRLYQCAGHNASNAAPAFCKPIKIEVPRPGERFGGGELAHNNPAELALSEVPKIWSHSKRCCIVSIGAGRQRAVKVVNIPHSSSKIKNNFTHSIQKRVSLLIPGVIKLSRISSDLSALQNIVEACIQPITNSEFLHQRILTSLEGINPEALRYHRFIVDQEMQHVGLEEWMEEMTTHTAAYMEERRTDQKKQVC